MKTGRPIKPGVHGQKSALGCRVTPEIKDALDAAAERNSRTQSQEVEARLELTFRAERALDQAMDALSRAVDWWETVQMVADGVGVSYAPGYEPSWLVQARKVLASVK